MIIATIIGAIAFLPSIALNIALALGAPLGAYAMNARYKVIQPEVRKAFIVPTSMQFVALFVLLSAGHVLPEIIPFMVTRILAFFFALYLTKNSSEQERTISEHNSATMLYRSSMVRNIEKKAQISKKSPIPPLI